MKLYLARHGNTFAPDDKVVWVGLKNDLELVDSGKQQALNLAQYFKKNNINFSSIYSGNLKRTKNFAKIIKSEHGLDLDEKISSALDELDYGNWTGLSNTEIKERYGSEELEAWDKYSHWPTSAGWSGSEEEVTKKVLEFAADLANKYSAEDNILVISSNGVLRYFLKLVPELFEEYRDSKKLKVATGNFCLLEKKGPNWQCLEWNVPVGCN